MNDKPNKNVMGDQRNIRENYCRTQILEKIWLKRKEEQRHADLMRFWERMEKQAGIWRGCLEVDNIFKEEKGKGQMREDIKAKMIRKERQTKKVR